MPVKNTKQKVDPFSRIGAENEESNLLAEALGKEDAATKVQKKKPPSRKEKKSDPPLVAVDRELDYVGMKLNFSKEDHKTLKMVSAFRGVSMTEYITALVKTDLSNYREIVKKMRALDER